MSRNPRKVAEVLETLKSQTTGANPTSRSPDSAISAQSMPDTVENLAFQTAHTGKYIETGQANDSTKQ